MKSRQATLFSILLLASPATACDGCLVIWASPAWALLLLICGVIGWKRTRVVESIASRASLLLLSFFGGFFGLVLLGSLTNVLVGFFCLGPSTLLTNFLLIRRMRNPLSDQSLSPNSDSQA